MAFFHMQIEFKLKPREKTNGERAEGNTREGVRFDEVAKGLTSIVPGTDGIRLQSRKRSRMARKRTEGQRKRELRADKASGGGPR